MRSYCFVILFGAAAFVAILGSVGTRAQDQDAPAKTTHAFQLRTVDKPADPEPTKQSDSERTETIRARIAAAKTVLDSGDYKAFFNDHVDPSWLARGAAGQGVSVDELLTKQLLGNPRQIKLFSERFGEVLEQSLTKEPRWLLNGRAASFMTGDSSHTAEFWIYFDGKWRISPET